MQGETQHTVLVIEADSTLRRLIALGLQYRGMQVVEASSPSALSSLEGQQFDLVVLDVDGEAGSNPSLLEEVQAHPYLATLPAVVLAWEVPTQAHVPYLMKPFDARALYATIEQILATDKEMATAQAGEISSADTSSDPSILPLAAAAGLLLAFVGVMIALPLAALGVLITVGVLLWWMLGTRPERRALPMKMKKATPQLLHVRPQHRHLERTPVILSEAKDLCSVARDPERSEG
jgi:CheY-like chemotaxis protein